MKEGQISVGSLRVEEDILNPEIIKRFDNHFQYHEIDENYYTKSQGDDAEHYKFILRYDKRKMLHLQP